MNNLILALQLAGVALVILAAFLTYIPLGIAACGFALFGLGWGLDRS